MGETLQFRKNSSLLFSKYDWVWLGWVRLKKKCRKSVKFEKTMKFILKTVKFEEKTYTAFLC